jgi:hypothetical protein
LKSSDKKKKKATENYEKALVETPKSINLYDTVNILIMWVRELFEIGGYTYNDRIGLLDFVIDELNKLTNGNQQLEAAVKNISLNKENLLMFVRKAETEMKFICDRENINTNIFYLLWKQRFYSESSTKYWEIENSIIKIAGQNIKVIRPLFDELVRKLVRASSIVECINSLIRPYLFLKRTLKGKFLDLLQFYFNTRKYMNSRVDERKGKSPFELLTGKEFGSWLEMLGY